MTNGTALLFGAVAALANVAGAAAVAQSARFGLRVIELLVAFAAGFMLALALVAAIPEALAHNAAAAAPVILLGYLLVHLTQHTLTPHFHFGVETHTISASASKAALIGLLLHTFFDGVAIASGFLVRPSLGLLFFAAIFLHKLPEGVAASSLVVAAGGGITRAYFAAALLGVATIAGVLLTSQVGVLAEYGLALSSGVTLYVGASNLVPEFQGKKGWSLPVAFFAGAAAFVAAHELVERVLA